MRSVNTLTYHRPKQVNPKKVFGAGTRNTHWEDDQMHIQANREAYGSVEDE